MHTDDRAFLFFTFILLIYIHYQYSFVCQLAILPIMIDNVQIFMYLKFSLDMEIDFDCVSTTNTSSLFIIWSVLFYFLQILQLRKAPLTCILGIYFWHNNGSCCYDDTHLVIHFVHEYFVAPIMYGLHVLPNMLLSSRYKEVIVLFCFYSRLGSNTFVLFISYSRQNNNNDIAYNNKFMMPWYLLNIEINCYDYYG